MPNIPNYLLKLDISAETASEWVVWGNDARVRRALNAPARPITLQNIVDYLRDGPKNGRYCIGIARRVAGRPAEKMIGVFEVLITAGHRNATIDMILDPDAPDAYLAISATMPQLLAELAKRGIEKAVAKVIARHELALRYLLSSDWKKEAELRHELVDATDPTKRVDVLQFGKLLA